MTNKERWDLLTAKLPSPQSYIDFGFYFLISLALQRRVWFYSGRAALYCNQYVTFVGPPAVGKGLVLSTVAYFAKHHKYDKGGVIKTSTGPELPALFPCGADSITFEELICDIAGSRRNVPGVEGSSHCSYAFMLPELSSLFKRKTEEVTKFLLNAYDCDAYEYKTKHQGKEILRKICLNFLAATQLDFLKDAHKTGLFGQGFASRTTFIFENRRRFDAFKIADVESAECKQAETELLSWIKQLSMLYGPLTFEPGTEEWLEDWYIKQHCPRELKASPRMLDYLGRKKVILLKLGAAIHFAESLETAVPLTCFQRAIKMLDHIEPQMEAGLNLTGRNELHIAARKMLAYINDRRVVTEKDIILTFGADYNVDEIFQALRELELGHGLKKVEDRDGIKYKI